MRRILFPLLLISASLHAQNFNVLGGIFDAGRADATTPARLGYGAPLAGDCAFPFQQGRVYERLDPSPGAAFYICLETSRGSGQWAWSVQGGAAPTNFPFNGLTGGTNNAASMVLGAGGSISPASATVGIVSANRINGTSLAGLGTGILKNTNGSGVPSIAGAADIVTLFSGCSGIDYLGADSGCHTPSAGGSPGGVNNSLQTKAGSSTFGGDSGLTYDGTNLHLASTSGISSVVSDAQATGTKQTFVEPTACSTGGFGNLQSGTCELFYLGGLHNPANYGNLAGKLVQANFYNGRNSPDNSDKKSLYGLGVYSNFPAGGQKFGILNSVTCAGTGDCFTTSNSVYYSSYSSAWGDEGVSGTSDQIIQSGNLVQPIITSKTVSPCAATVITQAVTKNSDYTVPPQTVTVNSSTGCSAGDWITIDYGPIGIANNEEIVQLTAAGAGTITAVFQADHAINAPAGPATVIAYANMSIGDNGPGTDKVWVDIDAAATTVTGTISSISGPNVVGSGTSWSNAMVGGTANAIGCMSFDADTVTVQPFYSRARPLISWYPIQSVTDSTHMVLQGYTGVAPAGAKFIIRPCSPQHETALSYSASGDTVTGIVLAYNTFAWTVGHQVEATISPFSSVNHGHIAAIWQTGPAGNLGSAYAALNYTPQPLLSAFQTQQSGGDGALWHPFYTGGITATGAAGATCLLSSFNGGGDGAASAYIELTGTNTIATGQVIHVTNSGYHYGTITSATASSGTATCSGTATLTSTPSFSFRYGLSLTAWTGSGVITVGGKDQSGTLLTAQTYAGDPKSILWAGSGGDGFIAPSGSSVGQLDMGASASKIHWSDNLGHPGFGAIWDFSAPVANFHNVTVAVPDASGTVCLGSTGCGFPGALTRTIPDGSTNNTIEIGYFGPDFAVQFGVFDISVGFEVGGTYHAAKRFIFGSSYQTAGSNWATVAPITSDINGAEDFALDVKDDGTKLYLRLRKTAGSNVNTAYIFLNRIVGLPSNTFTSTSAVSNQSAPGVSWPSSVITQSSNMLGIVNASTFVATVDPTALTANRTISLPDAAGTMPLIPGTPTVNRAVCWKTAATLGYCSTQPDGSGSCTCN